MIGLDIWNYDKYWDNQIIATIVVGSIVFIYVFQKSFKINKVRKIIAILREPIKNMYEAKLKEANDKS